MFKFDPKKIIKKHNAKALCRLNCDKFIELSICLMYDYFYDNASSLNKEQRIVFLCMALEAACQADSIISLTDDEEIFFSLPEAVEALKTIGSPKTAYELQKFIALMPENTFEKRIMPEAYWFFGDQERNAKINDIDKAISDYPDGITGELLWKYCTSDVGRAKSILENL